MDEEIIIDNNYNFIVDLWPGAGYWMQRFKVNASDAMQAVEIVVAYCDNNNLHGFLIDVEDVEDEEEDNYIYIDATMEGATKPYYIFNELHIEEINN